MLNVLGQSNGSFSTPTLGIRGHFGYAESAGSWRVNQHVREVADVNSDGRADIIGFGNGSVAVALGQSNGSFAAPTLGIRGHFGYAESAGSWRVNQHVRKVADVNGDGRADIVGFGNGSVSVALGQTNGSFATPILGIRGHFARDDGWRVDQHVREVADVNGDGRADIVGFGDASVSVALGQTNGSF